MDRNGLETDLPGFRFHPTEEELLDFYLRRVAHGKKLPFDIIATVHLYRHDPWELPELAKVGEREWYFFVPRDRRQAGGGRPNRTTERGFWKATGSDRPIRSADDPRRLIGLKKTLVYYRGRAPRGSKTDWVMNEYRLPDSPTATPAPEDIVLCKVYRKATPLKELEQRAAMCGGATVGTVSQSDQETQINGWTAVDRGKGVHKSIVEVSSSTSTVLSVGLPEIEVPQYSGLEWTQDPVLTQLSPWIEPWSPYANLFNF